VNRVDPRGRDIIGFVLQLDSVIIDVASEELVSEEIDKVPMCVVFDLVMENGPADTKFPWWYCELGSILCYNLEVSVIPELSMSMSGKAGANE
jgi:hypothetical protein